MTVKNPLYLQPKLYPALQDRALVAAMVGDIEHVAGPTGLVPSLSSGVTTTVTSGKAFVKGDTNAGQGFYLFECSASENQVHTRDVTNPRINTIVARVYDATEVGSGSDQGVIEIVAGTPTSGATLTNLNGLAALPASAMILAYVLVPTVGNATVLDKRPMIGSFSVYRNAAFSPANGAASKISYDTVEWNYANLVDITNGRFTPNVAGIWRLSAFQRILTDTYGFLYIYKNGSLYKVIQGQYPSGATAGSDTTGVATPSGSMLITTNGTTDYFEIFTQHGAAAPLSYDTGSSYSYFQGEYVNSLI